MVNLAKCKREKKEEIYDAPNKIERVNDWVNEREGNDDSTLCVKMIVIKTVCIFLYVCLI